MSTYLTNYIRKIDSSFTVGDNCPKSGRIPVYTTRGQPCTSENTCLHFVPETDILFNVVNQFLIAGRNLVPSLATRY